MSKSGEMVMPRASSALSSLAVSVVLAMLTVLAIVGGVIQDSRAETATTMAKGESASVVDFASGTRAGDSPMVQASASSQRQIVRGVSIPSGARKVGPMGEWLGVSKLAFPLLVTDLTGGVPMTRPTVMSGRFAGVR